MGTSLSGRQGGTDGVGRDGRHENNRVFTGHPSVGKEGTMHALLRSLTMDEAKKITSGYEATEAWESRKALCRHYEPVMALQKHKVLEYYLTIVSAQQRVRRRQRGR